MLHRGQYTKGKVIHVHIYVELDSYKLDMHVIEGGTVLTIKVTGACTLLYNLCKSRPRRSRVRVRSYRLVMKLAN